MERDTMDKLNTSHIKTSSEETFSFIFRTLDIFGFPIKSRKLPLYRSVYNKATGIFLYALVVCIVGYIFIESNDLKDVMAAVRPLVIASICTWIEITFSYHADTLERLYRKTEYFSWDDMPLTDNETGDLTKAGLLRVVDSIGKKSVFGLFFIHLSLSAIRVFGFREMMYPMWFPMDISTSPGFEIIMLIQIIATMRAGATFYTAPYFYAKLICIACVQLEKVRGSLLSIKQENEIGKKYTSINIGKSENRAHEINEHLKYLICHHNQTLSYINNLQEFFSMLMCGILFLFMISLCASAFSVMMTLNDTVDASQGAVMYLAVVVMAYFYCNFGTMLAREYEAVGDAAFASDWIGAPVPYQRSLSFIILVANKGKTLVAGHIVPITNETLMAMINESMSLFMFLLTMKEKSDENM